MTMSRLKVSWVIAALACAGCSGEDPGTSSGAGGSGGNAAAGGGASGGSSGSASGGSTSGGSATGGGGGVGGTSGTGGSGGTGGTTPGLESCPTPPEGSSAASVLALNTINTLRLAMDIECMELVTEINAAAQNHCDYYALNAGDDDCQMGHDEVEGCPGFTGESAGQRMTYAGYDGFGWSEVMAFQNDPEGAIAAWVNSAWHRTPLLSPWYRHMGYGGAEDCDTIDLSRGPTTPDDVTALFPYAGQTGVPVEFHGDREGPEPPEPPTGWPSASPVHLYIRDFDVTTHSIEVDGSGAPLDHVWIGYGDAANGDSQYILYAHEPFQPATTYRVQIAGTRGGEPLSFDWTFTTED